MTLHIGPRLLWAAGPVALIAALAVMAGLVSISQVLWLGVIVICPLMMFFMMRGMGAGSAAKQPAAKDQISPR